MLRWWARMLSLVCFLSAVVLSAMAQAADTQDPDLLRQAKMRASMQAQALTAEKLQAVLGAALPPYAIQVSQKNQSSGFGYNLKATATVDGQTLDLDFPFLQYNALSGTPLITAVVRFVAEEEARLAAFDEGKPVPPPAHPAVLVVGNPAAPQESRAAVLDSRASALRTARINIADSTGGGKPQLCVEALMVYTKNDPPQYVTAQRVFLYSLPDLKELLAVTAERIWSCQGVGEIKKRRVEFLNVPPKFVLRLTVEKTQKFEVIEAQDGRYAYVEDDAWDPLHASEATNDPGSIYLQVVDSQGKTISNAKITDARAEKKRSLRGAQSFNETVSLKVEAPGYYPEYCQWAWRELPKDVHTVTLSPAPPSVS